MSLTFDSKLSAARASAIEALERRVLLSTYYVSPSGSDTNPGTLAAPWQTIAKVNDTVFSPGDQILLARGGQWRESLNASADGAPGAPIVYGNYGDANLPKPLLIGSDILLTSRFTLLSGTTYTLQSTTPINWIYDNHAFTHNSEVFLRTSGSGDPSAEADNVNYVEQNAESFYYDASSATLYLNVGSSPAAHLITAAVREDAVYNNRHSNIHFVGLAATETAHDGGGYAFRSQLGDNIQIIDCDASLAGKHEFGAIDSNNFLGENLTAQLAAPDLGYGGSSAYVSYSDSVNGRANDSAQWINLTWSNPGGAYPIFISHGDPGAIGSLFLQNLVSLGGYGTGIIIYSTGPQERIVLLGGHLDGGTIQLDPDYSVVDGLTLTGDGADLFLGGSNDVVQNSRLIGLAPNPFIGRNGGIIDGGFNNTIRFNTFHWNDEPGPGVSITHNNSNTHIYANLFDVNQPIRLLYNTGGSLLDSDYNLFGTSYDTAPVFGVGDVNTPGKYTLAQWHANGYDLDSVVGDPKFNDAADGDLTLQSTSPALDLYTQTPDATPTSANHDLKGDTRPLGPAYDAGAFEAPGPPLVLNGTTGPDAFYIRVDAANPAAVDVWQNTGHDGSGLPTFISPFDAFYSIIVNGGGGGDGGDLLTLDFSNGPFGAPGITYNAGDGSGSGAGGNDAGGAIVAGGADSISVIGTTGSDNITVDSAQVQVNSITITLAQPTVVNVDGKGGSDTLTANAPVALLYDPASFDGGLTLNANAAVSFAASIAQAGVTPRWIAGLNIADNASVMLAPKSGASDATVLVLSQLNVAPTGRLDLGYGALIAKGGNLATITAKLATGMSTAGLGAWNGYGIMSATAAGDSSHIRAVGVMLNDNGHGGPIYGATTPYGPFEGQNPATGDVLVRLTYYGDADLSGQVDGGDYSKTDNGFNTRMGTSAGWSNGDYNYDGTVDGSDYALIDNAFALQSAQPAARPVGYLPPPMTASTASVVDAHPAAQIRAASAPSSPALKVFLVRDLLSAPDDLHGVPNKSPDGPTLLQK